MKKIILASSSPRRKELLRQHKIDFIVDFQEIEEVLDESLTLPLRLEKLALQKAKPIALKYPYDLVIGADTMVCLNEKMLGKPKNRQEAFKMLSSLSGKKQIVYTAIAFIEGKKVTTLCKGTEVYFKTLTVQEIMQYLDLDEWIGKAGAYAIQGNGSTLVEKIVGDIETVIGLPVAEVEKYLNNN